ncbi:hypothetical protein SCUP515_01004 [Seiridium cupressi]
MRSSVPEALSKYLRTVSSTLISSSESDDLDDLERSRARLKKTLAIRTSMVDLSELLDDVLGKEVRKKFRDNLVDRGNTPSITEHFVPRYKWHPGVAAASKKLWVADRILEHQTIGQFLVSAMGHTPLPTGELVSQPLDENEWFLLTEAYSDWAPSPFNAEETVPIDSIYHHIGSLEDSDRGQITSKEMQAMKARLWEGIMPLSTRRWREKQLDDPKNFSAACRILSMVVNVFLYLNVDAVQAALKETFLLIDSVLRTFEDALNSKRALEGKPAVEVSRKWHQHIRAKYAVLVNRSHGWVLSHVDHMKSMVLEQLEALVTSPPSTSESYNEELMRLYDMEQDLCELSAQADYAILMSMDGYDGSEVGQQRPRYNHRTQPLRPALEIRRRNLDYHRRRGHLIMKMECDHVAMSLGNPETSPLEQITRTPRLQNSVQQVIRQELRGEPVRHEKEAWITLLREVEQWGFVVTHFPKWLLSTSGVAKVYRSCHSCTDDEWDNFGARFGADQADWGSELMGVDELRQRSKLYWLDTKNLGIDCADIEVLKSSFREFAESDDFPSNFTTDIFLLADEASVASYLSPRPELL